jgi:hypothetical protein
VGIKGNDTIISGELQHKIDPEESVWELGKYIQLKTIDNNTVIITFFKIKSEWWRYFLN